MNLDHTQQQTQRDVQRSEELSRQSTLPPSIPGYLIQQLLGEGAFGQVWLATDMNTRRLVAIKCYVQRTHLNLESLSREVSLLANMAAARNIVQILKVGWEHDPPYYVMEYLENGSLEDLVRSRQEVSVSQVVTLMREIAEGLSFAHGKGILHCDLKPANVLLDHAYRPRLADFGQGRMAGDQSSSLGTLFYMSPDQADLESSPDVTWDVYSLGAIAYTLIVGIPPYRTTEVVDSLDSAGSLPDRLERYRKAIGEAPKPQLHYKRRGVDKAFAQIVDRCLKVRPEQRFQNVQQLIGALDNRQRSRSRRPLYVLGLIGPILLMSLMLFFSSRSRSVALDQSERSVVQRALESNQFAARYAARTLESEIQALFRIAEVEAEHPELHQLLKNCMQAGADALQTLASSGADGAARESIQQLPERLALEEYLKKRITRIGTNHNEAHTLLNSIFVNERTGTNVGAYFADAYERQNATTPVGQNFAYRSYFTGDRLDGSSALPRSNYRPTRATRLSASFRSSSTGAWKIGISAPVWAVEDLVDGAPPTDERVLPLGVLVLTINLGDFELLTEGQENDARPLRFAALFDGRHGNQLGTLLQHPLIRKLDRETMKTIGIPQIPLPVVEQLISTGLDSYQDPAAAFEGGQIYGGEWLATSAQVELPRTNADSGENRTKSDLWILVQERKDSVSAPIQSLSDKLSRESWIEIAALLSVILALWYFVFRLRQTAAGRRSFHYGSSDTSSSAPTETSRL